MLARSITATRVEVKQKTGVLKIDWQNGETSEIDFMTLRKHCACSYCRAGNVFGTAQNEADSQVTNVSPMGSTGLQIIFADGHDRGIYPWGYLEAIGMGRGMDYFNELE